LAEQDLRLFEDSRAIFEDHLGRASEVMTDRDQAAGLIASCALLGPFREDIVVFGNPQHLGPVS
jgi:hypothetical protein